MANRDFLQPAMPDEGLPSDKLNRWSALTFDYQFIADPAYNADRGPVSIFSARAHAEF